MYAVIVVLEMRFNERRHRALSIGTGGMGIGLLSTSSQSGGAARASLYVRCKYQIYILYADLPLKRCKRLESPSKHSTGPNRD